MGQTDQFHGTMKTHRIRQCLVPCSRDDQRLTTLENSIAVRYGMVVPLPRLARLLFALPHPCSQDLKKV